MLYKLWLKMRDFFFGCESEVKSIVRIPTKEYPNHYPQLEVTSSIDYIMLYRTYETRTKKYNEPSAIVARKCQKLGIKIKPTPYFLRRY